MDLMIRMKRRLPDHSMGNCTSTAFRLAGSPGPHAPKSLIRMDPLKSGSSLSDSPFLMPARRDDQGLAADIWAAICSAA